MRDQNLGTKLIEIQRLNQEFASREQEMCNIHAAEISGIKANLNTAEITAAGLRQQMSEMRAAEDMAKTQVTNQLVEIQRLNQEFASREQEMRNIHAVEISGINANLNTAEVTAAGLRQQMSEMRAAEDLAKAQLTNQLVETQRLNQEFASREREMRNVHAAEIGGIKAELAIRELVIQRQAEKEKAYESQRVDYELRLCQLADERNELQQCISVLHGQLATLQYSALDNQSLADQERRRLAAELADLNGQLNEVQHRLQSAADANSQESRARAVEIMDATEQIKKLEHQLAEARAKTERVSGLLTAAQTSATEQANRHDRDLASFRKQLDAAKRQLTFRFEQLVWLAHLFDKTIHSFSIALNDVPKSQDGRLLTAQGGILRITPILEQSAPAFLAATYHAFLGRQPDSAGKEAYLTSLAEGKSKVQVLLEIAFSSEARSTRQALNTGNGQVVLADNLADILSFDAEDFLWSAYQSLLGRDPDAAGLAAYTEKLEGGAPKISIFLNIAQSEEGCMHRGLLKNSDQLIPFAASMSELMDYNGEKFVRAAYIGLLGREPDSEGLANYLRVCERPRGKQRVLEQLARSDEVLSPYAGSKLGHALLAARNRRGMLPRFIEAIVRPRGSSYAAKAALESARLTNQGLMHVQFRLLKSIAAANERNDSAQSTLKVVLNRGNRALAEGVAERNLLQLRQPADQLQTIDAFDGGAVEYEKTKENKTNLSIELILQRIRAEML
jgi:hypothetical protein